MDLIGFLYTMTEAVNGQRLSKGLTSKAIGFFFKGSAQKAYSNVFHPDTHDPIRLLVIWPLTCPSLLISFITDGLLCNYHYAVTSTRIKQTETEI